MIEIRKVSHAYGATQALAGVTIDVPAGSVVGLVGPNGAGKTTLIRAIATLLRQDRGVVRVAGYDTVGEARKARASLGYLPERASPYSDLLAWEHLDLFARIAGHHGPERGRRIDAALEAAGLSARRSTPCGQLSKGLRQGLALQACLLHDPRALVLDEPTDGLDPDSREALLATVRRLADQGVAVLLSSHVLAELEEAADSVVILSRGAVVEEVADTAGPRFRLVLRDGLAAALELARTLPEVARAELVDDGLMVEITGAPDAAGLVAALVGAGSQVVEVVREEARLRDRYRTAVGGDR